MKGKINNGIIVSEKTANLLNSMQGDSFDTQTLNGLSDNTGNDAVMEKLNGKIDDKDKAVFGFDDKDKTHLIGSKEETNANGLTAEQEGNIRKMYHNEVIKHFKTAFTQIADLMIRKGKTLMEIHDEIDRKVCDLPRGARETVKGFRPEALMEYLKDFGIEESEMGTKTLEA